MQARSYEPYRLCFQLVAVILGAAYLVVTPVPGSVSAVVGERAHWLVYLWAGGLMVSGFGALIGSLWAVWQDVDKDKIIIGYAIERGSLTVQTGALFVITGATLYVNGMRGALGVGILLAWMAANVWRDRQIASVLRTARKQSEPIEE